ncbi:MAG TPA: LptA/OstA family protein [Vicinamibacterales bacterium]|nr:LptA/OstA family protein [Vicinamibacterales bacterium]
MARWQRHARLGLGIFAVVFAAVLYFVIGERRTPAAVQGVERIDPTASSEIKGGDAIQVKGEKRDVRVEFASQISYTDGRTKYTGFKAFIDNRGGRSFTVAGDEALTGAELSTYDLSGNVTLNTSDGLTATTPRATFTEADGIMKGDGPVQFNRARVTGSGVGFTYDRAVDRLWLLNQAVIEVAAKDGQGGMRVTSGAAGHSRLERYMRFERGMRMERQGQVMEADNSTVFLLKDRDEPENVELRGNSKITGGTGTGSLQAMQARDINLHYADDGRTLEQALLVGKAGVQLARPDGSPGNQLIAETIDAQLAPDGSITSLSGREQVTVNLPATGEAAARAVKSQLLNASGQSGRGITAMTFENGVEYREDAARGGTPRVARARTLQAGMSGNGTIEQATFSGGFKFEDGRLAASSTDAIYDVIKGTLSLRSSAGATVPDLADERVTVRAQNIDVTLSPRSMTATGSVSAQFSPGRRAGERGTSLLSDKEAVMINAEVFVFDETAGTGTYSGKAATEEVKTATQAVLYQQESGTTIRGDTITLNEKTGSLIATGNVLANLPIAGRGEGAKGNSVARAGEFQFEEAKRRAVFIKQAQLDGVQGALRANRIELFLAAKDNSLERMVADGAVTAGIEKRVATGQHMTYHPAEEKYVMTGTPVRLTQECQESTGRTLTFYRASNNVVVDGNEEIRVQTKGGSKCPEPPK